MNILTCQQLDVTIGETSVVNQLDLNLADGQFWGLLGANGAGKTTLLKHLAGLMEPDSGRVLLKETDLHQVPRRELARHLGMLQQHTAYVFDASALQVALTGRHPYLGPWQKEDIEDFRIAEAALRDMDLAALTERSVTSLSGGEARRLAFAALLAQQPQVMLLDEPTNHLDFRHQVKIMQRVGDEVYTEHKTALAALHDVNLAATYCSHVLLLTGAGQWKAGPSSELLTVENLEALYKCPVSAVETPDGVRFHPSFSAARSA